MGTHKSADKKMRHDEKRRASNRSHIKTLRTKIKELRSVLDKKDIPSAQKMLPETISLIDKTVSKGLLHKNTGARYKSNLTGKLNQLSGKAQENQ
jgi:small subunit ribosomal protein S20